MAGAWRSATGWITASHESLDTLLKLTTGQEDPAVACSTPKADISAQAYHIPFVTTTRMRFAQSNNIAKANLYGHDGAGFKVREPTPSQIIVA